MRKFEVIFICGTRPEAIKIAPVVEQMCKENKINLTVCLTNQHQDLHEDVFSFFKIKKNIFINLKNKKLNSLTDASVNILQQINSCISKKKYDLMVVHGDTNSAFCGAICAFYNKILLCHIESGLRTNKKYFPFPEEIYRKFIDSVSDIHFCPTKSNLNNLKKENIDTKNSFVVGNTVIDVIKKNKNKVNEKKIIIVTLHRRELWGKNFEKVLNCLNKLSKNIKDYKIYYILNKNIILQKLVKNKFKNNKNIKIFKNLNHKDFHNLIKQSSFVITDSGGLQEECTWLEKPVFVLRNETERPEIIEAKTGRLLTTDIDKIYNILYKFIIEKNIIFQKNKYLFGRGDSSRKITKYIVKFLESTNIKICQTKKN